MWSETNIAYHCLPCSDASAMSVPAAMMMIVNDEAGDNDSLDHANDTTNALLNNGMDMEE